MAVFCPKIIYFMLDYKMIISFFFENITVRLLINCVRLKQEIASLRCHKKNREKYLHVS